MTNYNNMNCSLIINSEIFFSESQNRILKSLYILFNQACHSILLITPFIAENNFKRSLYNIWKLQNPPGLEIMKQIPSITLFAQFLP